MASRPKKAAEAASVPFNIVKIEYRDRARPWWEIQLMVQGAIALTILLLLLLTPIAVAAYNTVISFYWPPPITSFHYMVTVHEDGASGDITAAGTGSVGK